MAVMVVTNSGREVPTATSVTAMTRSGTPNSVASVLPERTKSWLPTARPTAPTTNSAMYFPGFPMSSARWETSASPWALAARTFCTKNTTKMRAMTAQPMKFSSPGRLKT